MITFLYTLASLAQFANDFIVFHCQHALRKVYDLNGRVQYTDSGYWFRELDRNAEKTIDSLVAPETPVQQEEIPMCNELPFCGLPAYTCRQLHTG